MATSRYQGRRVAVNSDDLYKNILDQRGLKFVRQYRTANLSYPSKEKIGRMMTDQHLWKMGDRFYKLAHHYYGDSKYWWVIAWFNKTPTENLLSVGQTVYIPLNLEEILDEYDV